MQRFGQIIGLKEDGIAAYEELHANVWPDVLATITACHIHNYSIYRWNTTLFAYFEYVGDDYAADMARMAADPVTRDWWALCMPLQQPLPGHGPDEWWATMREVFHTN